MSHNVPSQYVKSVKYTTYFMVKLGQEDNMIRGSTKLFDTGVIFHSFTMGELLISVLLLIIIIILLVNINKKD